MATFRKTKSKTWLAEIRKFGQRKSKTFPTKLQAQAWAVEMEQSMESGTLVMGKTFGDAFSRYQREVTPRKKSHRNEHNRLNNLMRDDLSNFKCEDLRSAHIYEWIEKELERIQGSSVNRTLNLLSAVIEQCKRWEWMATNPVKGIKRPKSPQPRDRRISDQEIERIMEALAFDGGTVKEQRDEIAVAFLLAVETAMRQGEIWGLDWSDVYIEQRYLTLHDTKNGEKRDVPLSTEAIRLLTLLKPKTKGRVLKSNQNSSGAIYRRAVKMAGINGLTFHDTRHEALTRLARKLDILDLARMVGHRDPRSLMIYYNPTAQEIANRLD